ncbi:MAG: hypothetical protein AB4911_22525 [Oscillochloridaceae bacterium umkhey_bin13]
MSDTVQSPVPEPPPPPTRPRYLAALPFVLTAGAAVLLSLLLQLWLLPRPVAQPDSTPTASLTATPVASTPTVAPATSPVPTVPVPTLAPASESLLRLELLDLRAENRRLWSTIYLLRAAAQLDDAIATLQVNEPNETDRTLLAAYRSLDQAYTFSAEQEKGPIDTFRLQLSQIRDDLRLRPEGLDRRLRQLRRLVLSLVDEGG